MSRHRSFRPTKTDVDKPSVPVDKPSIPVDKPSVKPINQSIQTQIEKIKTHLESIFVKNINYLAKFQQKENTSLVKEVGLIVKKSFREEWNKAIKEQEDHHGEIQHLNKQHEKATGDLENKIKELRINLEKERKKFKDQKSNTDVADEKLAEVKKEIKKLTAEVEEFKFLTAQYNEKDDIVLKNLFDDEKSKRFIQKIPSDNLNTVYSVLVILESNLFISKTISSHDNASQVIDTKRENTTLQIISAYLMDAVNDNKLDDNFVKEIIEFVNNKSNSYEILQPERFFNSDIHKPISDGGGSLKDVEKHYSLPIRLKDARPDTVKITKGLVQPR